MRRKHDFFEMFLYTFFLNGRDYFTEGTLSHLIFICFVIYQLARIT